MSAKTKRKRRRAAPAGRVLATGLSASAMFGIVSAMAMQPPPQWGQSPTIGAADNQAGGPPESSTVPTTTVAEPTSIATTIVTRVERRVIYVQDDGTPAAPVQRTPTGTPAPVPVNTPAPSGGGGGGGTTPPPAPAPTVAPPPPTTAAPAPTTTAPPKPTCSGSKC